MNEVTISEHNFIFPFLCTFITTYRTCIHHSVIISCRITTFNDPELEGKCYYEQSKINEETMEYMDCHLSSVLQFNYIHKSKVVE